MKIIQGSSGEGPDWTRSYPCRRAGRAQWTFVLAALALVLGEGSGSVQAAEHSPSRELTLWIADAIRIQQGDPPRRDWSASGAPSYAEVIDLVNVRPTLSGPELTVGTEHFLIHYTLEGQDAATAEQLAWTQASLEQVWDRIVHQLGYPAPPSDGSRGGDGRYDVYWNKQLGTYGYCAGDMALDDNSMTSYLALANWMGEVETYVTIAHEFFHAIHFALDSKEEDWLFEVTATWMEDQVYDEINDYYNYLDSVASAPETPVTANSGIMYGYAIFGHALSETLGLDIVKQIWEQCSLSATPSALTETVALVDGQSDWETFIHGFREALVDLSRFSEGSGYRTAMNGGIEATLSVTRYPADGSFAVAPTGAAFVELEPLTDAGTLEIHTSGDSNLRISLLLLRPDGSYEERAGDQLPGTSFQVSDFGGTIAGAWLVATHIGTTTDVQFAFDAAIPDVSTGCSMASQHGYPRLPGLLLVLGLAGAAMRRRRTHPTDTPDR